jgi:glycosyltransferase involved in cell wall biosynthesis
MPLEPLRRQAGYRVRFVPRFVSEDELRAVFRRADVVVLPYWRTERLDHSGVLSTALAFGKATIVTEVGSFPEAAAEGAAWVVPPGDPTALANALSVLACDYDARKRLGRDARTAARRSYSWGEAAVRTLHVYEQVTGGRQKSLGDPRQSRPP